MTNNTPSLRIRLGLYFGMLFAVAFIAWAVFNLVRDGSVHPLPGIIVAVIWGALGTYIALRTSGQHDLRGRDAAEGYAVRQVERTMARNGTPLAFRISRSRSGHAIGGD